MEDAKQARPTACAQIEELSKKMSACMKHYYKHKDDPEWRAAYNERKTREAMKRYHSNEEERRKKIERAKSRYWRLKAEKEAKQVQEE